MRATTSAGSRPSTRDKAAAIPSSSSSIRSVANQAKWSARSAGRTSAGSASRTATIARQARPVPSIRARGTVANGMPKRPKPTRASAVSAGV